MRHGPPVRVGLPIVAFVVQALLAVLLWTSGTPHGTWTFECGVGALAWDLGHGLNPHWPLLDYFDSWTSGYLVAALVAAPAMLVLKPIVALKLLSLFTVAATGLLAWRGLRLTAGEDAASIGTVGFLLGPPMLWYYAIRAGDYHYSELLGVLLLWAVVAGVATGAPPLRGRFAGAAAVGAAAGFACLLSFGALAGVAILLTLWVLVRRSSWWDLAALPAAALASAPLLWKLTVHRPFGVEAIEGSFGVPYAVGRWRWGELLRELLDVPRGLGANLGWAEVAPGLAPIDAAVAPLLLVACAWGVARAVPLLLLAARARLRGAHLDDGSVRRLLAWAPALIATALVATWLVLPAELRPAIEGREQLRDNRFLPPALGLMVLNLGPALADGMRLLLPGRRLPVLPVAAVVGLLGALGAGAMVDWASVGGAIPYRGRCYDVLGVYAARHVPLGDGALHRPELCGGFPDEGRAPCLRGRAWGIGMRETHGGAIDPRSSSGRRLVQGAGERCAQLPAGLDEDCVRHLGWTLNWIGTGTDRPLLSMLAPRCELLPREQRLVCLEGTGVWFADHLGAWPERFDRLYPDDPLVPGGRGAAARGLGSYLAHTYQDRAAAIARCGLLGPDVESACLDGVAVGFAVHDRPFPP